MSIVQVDYCILRTNIECRWLQLLLFHQQKCCDAKRLGSLAEGVRRRYPSTLG